eukprot:763522-Hanusia_phi.AAC.1
MGSPGSKKSAESGAGVKHEKKTKIFLPLLIVDEAESIFASSALLLCTSTRQTAAPPIPYGAWRHLFYDEQRCWLGVGVGYELRNDIVPGSIQPAVAGSCNNTRRPGVVAEKQPNHAFCPHKQHRCETFTACLLHCTPGQSPQVKAPVSFAWKGPEASGHFGQRKRPVMLDAVPGGHGVQAAAPSLSEKLPAGHGVQSVCPGLLTGSISQSARREPRVGGVTRSGITTPTPSTCDSPSGPQCTGVSLVICTMMQCHDSHCHGDEAVRQSHLYYQIRG